MSTSNDNGPTLRSNLFIAAQPQHLRGANEGYNEAPKDGIDNPLNKSLFPKTYKINPMPFLGQAAI